MEISRSTFVASLIAVAAGSGAIGGVAGSATASYASPRAIVAAVEHVQDAKADADLAAIRTELEPQSLTSRGQNVYSILGGICEGSGEVDCGQP